MKYQKFLAVCFAAFAFAACGDKEETGPDVPPETGGSVETTAFSAVVKYTFTGLSSKDAAYGDFLTLYCEAGGQGAEAFDAWKDGNDKPGCEVFRRGTASSAGGYEAKIENLKPDTEYDYCVCFKSEDGENRRMSSPSTFRTAAFAPEFSALEAVNIGFQKTGLQASLSGLDAADTKLCTFGFVLGNGSSPQLETGTDIRATPSEDGLMNAKYENLKPNTQYWCRPYVKVNAGGSVVYGGEFTFTTRDFDEVKVDMGLPSGICWASCNLDAETYSEAGGYYLFGDITPNKYGSTDRDSWLYDASGDSCRFVGEIAGTDRDPVHVRLGGKWRMPTKADVEELLDNCHLQDYATADTYVLQFTANNGAVILVPFAGYRSDGHVQYFMKDGKAWMIDDDKYSANILSIFIPTGTQYYNPGSWRYSSKVWAYSILYKDYVNKKYSEIESYDGIPGTTDFAGLLHMADVYRGYPIRPVWDPNL